MSSTSSVSSVCTDRQGMGREGSRERGWGERARGLVSGGRGRAEGAAARVELEEALLDEGVPRRPQAEDLLDEVVEEGVDLEEHEHIGHARAEEVESQLPVLVGEAAAEEVGEVRDQGLRRRGRRGAPGAWNFWALSLGGGATRELVLSAPLAAQGRRATGGTLYFTQDFAIPSLGLW